MYFSQNSGGSFRRLCRLFITYYIYSDLLDSQELSALHPCSLRPVGAHPLVMETHESAILIPRYIIDQIIDPRLRPTATPQASLRNRQPYEVCCSSNLDSKRDRFALRVPPTLQRESLKKSSTRSLHVNYSTASSAFEAMCKKFLLIFLSELDPSRETSSVSPGARLCGGLPR